MSTRRLVRGSTLSAVLLLSGAAAAQVGPPAVPSDAVPSDAVPSPVADAALPGKSPPAAAPPPPVAPAGAPGAASSNVPTPSESGELPASEPPSESGAVSPVSRGTLEAVPSPADAPDTPDASTEAAASKDVAEIEQALADQAASRGDYKLDVYGFADFTYSHQLSEFAYTTPFATFAVGRFNLYLAGELGDSWRTLAEVRFTYLPNGNAVTDAVGTTTRENTSVSDYTDLNRQVRVGGTIIERAWLEYSAHPMLTVRAGHWLTPYGIWNTDHGSPVIIGVRRPYIVGERLMPESQTGIELHGSEHFGRSEVGYHVTLSNGRGPIDTYQDLDANKALGGRVFVSTDADFGQLAGGISGYFGKYTDRGQEFGLDANGNFVTLRPVLASYDEASIALDFKWVHRGFLVQAEAIVNDAVYSEPRPAQTFGFGLAPDYRRVGVYGLGGYRFEWLGLMPFGGLEYYDPGKSMQLAAPAAALWGGINLRPTPRVVLKAQYTYSWNTGQSPIPESHFNNLDFQAAWSF